MGAYSWDASIILLISERRNWTIVQLLSLLKNLVIPQSVFICIYCLVKRAWFFWHKQVELIVIATVIFMSVSFCFNRKSELSDSSAVLEAFKFIESAAAEFSDEDEEEDSEGKDRTIVESRTVRKSCAFVSSYKLHKLNQLLLNHQNDPLALPRSWGRSRHRHRCQPAWTSPRTRTRRRHWKVLTSCLVLMKWTPRRSPEALGTAQTGVSHDAVFVKKSMKCIVGNGQKNIHTFVGSSFRHTVGT